MNRYDFIIIGAGAAGLVAAKTAGKAGKSVVLIDHMEDPARKLLITGGGKCNFSNKNVRWDRYASENPHFCKSALSRLTTNDILDVLKQNRIPYTQKNDGKLFLNAAATLRDFLFEQIRIPFGGVVGQGIDAVGRRNQQIRLCSGGGRRIRQSGSHPRRDRHGGFVVKNNGVPRLFGVVFRGRMRRRDR